MCEHIQKLILMMLNNDPNVTDEQLARVVIHTSTCETCQIKLFENVSPDLLEELKVRVEQKN